MTTIPTGSQYETIIDSYLGTGLTNQQVGFGTKKDALWLQFLQENGLSSTDPLVAMQDPQILSKFMVFVQKTYDSLQTGELSPDEVTKRKLMFSVYDLIMLMLQVLQQTVGVVGKNVAFLGQYQQAYAEMSGREALAFYKGGSLSIPQANINDLSNWTLGYGNITMEEYLKTALQNTKIGLTDANGGAEIHSINIALPPVNTNIQPNVQGIDTAVIKDGLSNVPIQIQAIGANAGSKNVTNDAMNTLRISPISPTQVAFSYTYKQQYNVTVHNFNWDNSDPPKIVETSKQDAAGFYSVPIIQYVNINPNDSYDKQLQTINAAFQSFLNTPMNNTSVIDPNYNYQPALFRTIDNNIPFPQQLTIYQSMTQAIPMYNMQPPGPTSTPTFFVHRYISTQWDPQYNMPYTTTSDENQNAYESAASRRRGQKNSLLQQFITNTQSKKQILSNQQDAENSQMDQARTGYSQGGSLLSTMIGQLSTIITSIFQGGK